MPSKTINKDKKNSKKNSNSQKRKKNNHKSSNNKNDNKLNSYYSSIRLLTSINNDLDLLSSNLDLKFKNNTFYKNIFPNINSNNNPYEHNSNLNINSYFYIKKNAYNDNSTKKNEKIKVMDNLYLYKHKTIPQKIYRQPELIKLKPIKNTFKTNSFHNLKFQNRKFDNYKGLRNILFPQKSPYSFYKAKGFYINNINNACKILLEKE